MNTRNMVAVLAAFVAALAAFGDSDAPAAAGKAAGDAVGAPTAEARSRKKISPERLRETIRRVQERKTGGTVRRAGSAKGVFVVLNAQRMVPAEAVASVVGALDRSIRVQAKVVSAEGVTAGSVGAEIAKAGGVLGVALVEGAGRRCSSRRRTAGRWWTWRRLRRTSPARPRWRRASARRRCVHSRSSREAHTLRAASR